MKIYIKKLIVCLCSLLSLPVVAEETIHFDYIDTKGYEVFCVFRDTDGIVWLGTSNGLTTYAQLEGGFPFSYVRHPRLNDIIKRIDQDNLGRLWLETQSLDVLIYDSHTNQLISTVDQYLRTFGIYVSDRFSHKSDVQGRVWIGENNKVYLRDFKKGKTTLYPLPASYGNVQEIEVNEQEALVATNKCIFSIPFSGGKPRIVAPIPLDPTFSNLFFGRDGRQNLFLATPLQCFRYDSRQRQWSRLSVKSMVVDITPVPKGRVLVGTSNDGTYTYDSFGNLIEHFVGSEPNMGGLPNSHLEHIYFDKANDMVINTYHKRGMSIYDHTENPFQIHHIAVAERQYRSEDVISLADAGNNSFWAGTEDNGVYRITADGSNQILENYFPNTAATMVFQDSQKRMWAGLYGTGLFCSDGRSFFPESSPFSMVEDAQGRLYVSLIGKGLYQLDPYTGETTPVITGNIWMMQIAYYNDKVYGLTGNHLLAVDCSTLKIDEIPISLFGENPSISVGAKALTIDHRGWLWMVSHRNHEEVQIYDIPHQKAYRVDRMERYIISAISEGCDGDVWCTTDLGMVRIVPITSDQTPTFKLYCYRGNQNSSDRYYNARALICLSNNHMLSGTADGYRLVDTEQLPHVLRKSRPHPVITSLRINDQDIAPADTTGRINFHCDILYAKKLVLDYNENNILLECRPRGFHQQVAGLFYYQLVGLSDQWIPMDNYVVRLSNLSPGQYRLRLRWQVDELDQWEEFELLTIHIRQPFWNTWWAWVIYLLLAAATFSSLWNFLRRRQEYQRKVQEMELLASHEKEMNDMKVRFFTNVSHDLRTPLTLIMTPVEELLNRKQPEETRKVLEVVDRNAHHLFSLVNQILDFQRLGNLQNVLSLDVVDVVQVISDECEKYRLMAQQRGMAFHFNASVPHLFMMVDADKLQKVINNLLSNAFKFTPDGGSIEVDVKKEDQLMTLQVKDTGRGIAEADLAHIFERYYVSKDQQLGNVSTGLGLNIVKQYVEMHGGTISVSKNTPKGTVFTIQMKNVENIVSDQKQPDPQAPEVENLEGEHILLVEDNPDMLTYMSSVLAADYTIYQATDGQQALGIMQNTDIDLVISDVMMAGMDGLELVRHIKEDVNISHIPVILLTAKAMAEDELRGLQMGANDYITKPFNFDILRLRIREQLARREESHQRFIKSTEVNPSEITITTVDEQLLKQVLDVVNKNMGNPDFNVDQLAAELNMHRTGLNRKLQAVTGQKPIVFLRTMRLKRAKQILEADPSMMVSQIAYEVGFNNPKKFSKYFKEEYGMYPSEFTSSLTENNG